MMIKSQSKVLLNTLVSIEIMIINDSETDALPRVKYNRNPVPSPCTAGMATAASAYEVQTVAALIFVSVVLRSCRVLMIILLFFSVLSYI